MREQKERLCPFFYPIEYHSTSQALNEVPWKTMWSNQTSILLVTENCGQLIVQI